MKAMTEEKKKLIAKKAKEALRRINNKPDEELDREEEIDRLRSMTVKEMVLETLAKDQAEKINSGTIGKPFRKN